MIISSCWGVLVYERQKIKSGHQDQDLGRNHCQKPIQMKPYPKKWKWEHVQVAGKNIVYINVGCQISSNFVLEALESIRFHSVIIFGK